MRTNERFDFVLKLENLRAIRTSIMCSCFFVIIFFFLWVSCCFLSFTAFLHKILSCNKSNTLVLSVIVNAVVIIIVVVVCLTYLNPIGIITGTKTLYTRFSRNKWQAEPVLRSLILKALYTIASGLFLELYILFGCFRYLYKIMVLLLWFWIKFSLKRA